MSELFSSAQYLPNKSSRFLNNCGIAQSMEGAVVEVVEVVFVINKWPTRGSRFGNAIRAEKELLHLVNLSIRVQ